MAANSQSQTQTQTQTQQQLLDRTTMAGMILNSNKVLDKALDPKTKLMTPGPNKFDKSKVKGVLFLSSIEAGFIFSGNIGTGILISNSNGKWSPPCAVGLTG